MKINQQRINPAIVELIQIGEGFSGTKLFGLSREETKENLRKAMKAAKEFAKQDATLKRHYISDAILHDLFYVISQEIGFTEEDIDSYEDDILDLIEIWQQQGFIGIYTITSGSKARSACNKDAHAQIPSYVSYSAKS
ncbi:hypothetical protein QE380_000104 [Acinetobacter baylyi]|uniref:Phage protein n=2 Tax=Acinetobacter baylyi TaxID=202950 RepID=A0ABU0URL1_ACIBI|nr:hypothetical protein [Acinetobacter baylyi]MDR6108318.1 hypothetical protein [Acinetobacter baylyi]MDR6184183.1 hypothetical protein [Acinetobacter baylyi]